MAFRTAAVLRCSIKSTGEIEQPNTWVGAAGTAAEVVQDRLRAAGRNAKDRAIVLCAVAEFAFTLAVVCSGGTRRSRREAMPGVVTFTEQGARI